jgi:hypothetical protein
MRQVSGREDRREEGREGHCGPQLGKGGRAQPREAKQKGGRVRKGTPNPVPPGLSGYRGITKLTNAKRSKPWQVRAPGQAAVLWSVQHG